MSEYSGCKFHTLIFYLFVGLDITSQPTVAGDKIKTPFIIYAAITDEICFKSDSYAFKSLMHPEKN